MAKRIVIATLGSLGDLHPYLALATGLEDLLGNSTYAENARRVARRVQSENGVQTACEAIEERLSALPGF